MNGKSNSMLIWSGVKVSNILCCWTNRCDACFLTIWSYFQRTRRVRSFVVENLRSGVWCSCVMWMEEGEENRVCLVNSVDTTTWLNVRSLASRAAMHLRTWSIYSLLLTIYLIRGRSHVCRGRTTKSFETKEHSNYHLGLTISQWMLWESLLSDTSHGEWS